MSSGSKSIDLSSSFPAVTPERRSQLQKLFENGNKQMSLGGHDYAADMFTECVLGDPGNMIYLQSFIVNLRKKFGEKKKTSIFAAFSTGGIKTAELQKKWANVVRSGLELLKSNPWNAAAFASLGKACLEMGYQETGLAYLKHSIDCNPNDADVNRIAAKNLTELQKFDDAIACWTRVKKLKPNDLEAEKAIGDLMVEKTIHRGGYSSAESSREVSKTGSTAAGKHSSVIAEGEDALGRQLTFEEQIQRRLKKDPNDTTAYIDLADHYFQAGMFKEAEDAYIKAKNNDLGKIDLEGQILETQKRRLHKELLKIKDVFEKEKKPELKDDFYAKKKEYEQKSLEVAQQRVEASPGTAGNHFELGMIYYQMGRIKEAIGEFQQAKSDITRQGDSLLALGQCFQQIKQYKLAATHYQEAIAKIDGGGENKKKALYLAAKLAIGLKDYVKADEYVQQLAAIDFSYKDVGDLLDKLASINNNV